MTDPLVYLTGWQHLDRHAASVQRAIGTAVLFWPSGRRTLEEYCASVIVHRTEAAVHGIGLGLAREAQLLKGVADFRRRIHPPGWWVKERKGRKQARRVRAVAWVNPYALDIRPIGPGKVIA